MVVNPHGIFMDQIPDYVNVIKPDRSTIWMGVATHEPYVKRNPSVIGLYGKTKCYLNKIMGLFPQKLNSEQQLWLSWCELIPKNKKRYDVAISYLNGYPNYYVMDKVIADKKVLWVHNEYQKLNYDAEYDRRFYHDCDNIITISDECVNSFVEIFPECKSKISILENISLSSEIVKKSNMYIPEELDCNDKIKLVSVGRLTQQKGFDLAIDAAKLIKSIIPNFVWIILGDGQDRDYLAKRIIDNGVEDNVKLVGIKDNPYVYIKNSDVFVQTSRFEGKSIVLDEAKILQKPIVVTKYPTVFDTIIDDVTGLIVDINAQAIADGITRLVSDKEARNRYVNNLKSINRGNEEEINKYISLML